MKKYIFIFNIIIFIIFGVFLFGRFATADSTYSPISGWAWSENIGWISFSSLNGGGTTNYGVYLRPDGVMEGYAWSENIGWITFNEDELTGCPQSPCSARLQIDGEVSGWARALNHGGGWNGWISLRGPDYGVYIETDSGDFLGWAWTDMNIGWISFNCRNEDSCSESPYRVYTGFSFIQNPDQPSDLDEDWNDCAYRELSLPTFKWKYSHPDNIPQAGYQIKIFGEEELDFSSDIASESYSPERPWVRDNLLFGEKTYSWQVRVKDENHNWSEWSEIKYFQTRQHAYPWIDFTWAPTRPNVDEITHFTDKSEVFGGSSKDTWQWTFPDGNPGNSNLVNPTTTFSSAGDKSISLKVTDSSGFACQRSRTINISLPLPEYREVAPVGLLNLPRNYLKRLEGVFNEQSERLSADILKNFRQLIRNLF